MLLEEARKCFTGGQFVATLILTATYAEQTTSELLEAHGVDVPWEAKQLFKVAGQRMILPTSLASRADQLRELRNAFVHRVPDDEKHDKLREERDRFTIGRRMAQLKRHPKAILEADAKEALEVMYAIFQLDLATSGSLRDEDHDEEDH